MIRNIFDSLKLDKRTYEFNLEPNRHFKSDTNFSNTKLDIYLFLIIKKKKKNGLACHRKTFSFPFFFTF